MAARRTNLALLGLTLLALVTGFAAFAIGTSSGWFVVVSHAVLGLGTALLARRKTNIARKGMKRGRSGRSLSIGLAVAAVVTITSGMLQVSGLVDGVGSLTMMQIHVGAGLVTLALVVVHSIQRPVRLHRTDLNRRNVIRAGGALGLAGLAYMATEGLWTVTSSPGSERRFTGSHEIVEASSVPVTQWLNDQVPQIDVLDHRVIVAGMTYSAHELAAFGDSMVATLDCTGGWYTTQSWAGVRVDRLIQGAEGMSVVVRSVTGYWRRFPLQDARRLLLATHLGDRPLSVGHGAPVRLVAPDRRGFWWVKWVTSVEVDDVPPWWQPPLPLA